jgi:hypothetical protein
MSPISRERVGKDGCAFSVASVDIYSTRLSLGLSSGALVIAFENIDFDGAPACFWVVADLGAPYSPQLRGHMPQWELPAT